MPSCNDGVAEMLREYAELLAISGGDPFKVRAYEKAARAVEGYPVEVAGLDLKALQAIPNVGERIAHKIREYLDTESVGELVKLRAQTPTELRALLAVPGLGPKRVHQIHQELGISCPAELVEALNDHRLRALRGWGARSEDNLAQSLHQAHSAAGRMQLAYALELAAGFLAQISALPGVERSAYAGSLRRMRDTVGDIDLLVAAAAPLPVMAAIIALPQIRQVLARGATKTSIVTSTGVQVDVRVVPPSAWGAAMLHFTGSKAHNIEIRALAVRAGWKLSEYGLFDADSGELIAGGTEEEIYARLGLPWIPPTLREGNGEVQLGLAGKLPHIVELPDIRGDLHSHTDLTDGVASLEDMIAGAVKRGYEYHAVTDHAPLLHMQRMTTAKAIDQRSHIRELESRNGIRLLHGTELNIQPDGSLDWDDEFLAGFDIVVASVHSQFHQSRTEMTKRLIRAVEHPSVNLLGHPTGRSIGRRPGIDADFDAVFAAAARTGTALEINSSPDRLDLTGELARRARHFGARFAISSDAHAVPHLENMRYGVATAQRGWVAPADVINTYPLEELLRFLGKCDRALPTPTH